MVDVPDSHLVTTLLADQKISRLQIKKYGDIDINLFRRGLDI